jgi:hypothetical protein
MRDEIAAQIHLPAVQIFFFDVKTPVSHVQIFAA